MAADSEVRNAFIEAVRASFRDAFEQIEHCLDQLPDDDLYWRPFERQNSICNLLLHLCGNVRQWIIAGVGGTPDVRDRPREFAERERISRGELLDRLRSTLFEADDVLARVATNDLLEPRRIQGFDTTVMQAIVDTVTHFVGHRQEITYITRLRLEDDYVFRWVPQSTEQGSE